MLPELQTAFRQALLGGESAAVLAQLLPDRVPGEARLSVYRNNVIGSLVEVLEVAFPATARLAGRDNFRFAVSRFAEQNPPTEPRLLAYGSGFPAWLAAFRPAQAKPWLAELARLEWARNEALFAADAEPLAPQALAALSPEAVPQLVFELHPSLRLLHASWPLHALWTAAQNETAQPADPAPGEECLLVLRPALSVIQLPLDAADGALVETLRAGATFGEAAETALVVEPDFDLQQALLGHLVRGTFVGFRKALTDER